MQFRIIYRLQFLFYVILSGKMLFGQNVSLTPDKLNILYLNIENPVTLTANNFSCEDLVLSIDNGSLKQNANCQFVITPKMHRKCNIEVKNLKGELISTKAFSVHELPSPVAHLKGKRFGHISPAELQMFTAVQATMDGFDLGVRVLNYKIRVFKKGKIVIDEFVDGPMITEPHRSLFKLLETDDIIYIYTVNTEVGSLKRICNYPILLSIM